jgi:hypothetical protein
MISTEGSIAATGNALAIELPAFYKRQADIMITRAKRVTWIVLVFCAGAIIGSAITYCAARCNW